VCRCDLCCWLAALVVVGVASMLHLLGVNSWAYGCLCNCAPVGYLAS
jgi:hypothetical protein